MERFRCWKFAARSTCDLWHEPVVSTTDCSRVFFSATGRLWRLIPDTEQLSNPLVWVCQDRWIICSQKRQTKKVETGRVYPISRRSSATSAFAEDRDVSWALKSWGSISVGSVSRCICQHRQVKTMNKFWIKKKIFSMRNRTCFQSMLARQQLHRILQKKTSFKVGKIFRQSLDHLTFGDQFLWISHVAWEDARPWNEVGALGFSEVWENFFFGSDRGSYSYRGIFSRSFNSKIASCHK